MTLTEAVQIQDAIEAIGGGCDREEYVAMHNFSAKEFAGIEYDAAVVEIEMRGSVRKALNFVRSVIDTYR